MPQATQQGTATTGVHLERERERLFKGDHERPDGVELQARHLLRHQRSARGPQQSVRALACINGGRNLSVTTQP
eukprot:1196165-Prorocentrum_minimum.AAC.4